MWKTVSDPHLVLSVKNKTNRHCAMGMSSTWGPPGRNSCKYKERHMDLWILGHTPPPTTTTKTFQILCYQDRPMTRNITTPKTHGMISSQYIVHSTIFNDCQTAKLDRKLANTKKVSEQLLKHYSSDSVQHLQYVGGSQKIDLKTEW